jgi:hypothetical protein
MLLVTELNLLAEVRILAKTPSMKEINWVIHIIA